MDPLLLIDYLLAFLSLYATLFLLLIFLSNYRTFGRKPNYARTPSISIIMPAHNEGIYIEECISSILSVDYPKNKLELIVVDDGSTDDTYMIAKSFEGENVKVFKKQNGGKASALNFGIQHAKGELIATMDGDSYLTKDVVRELVPFFSDSEVMAVSPAVKIRPSGSWIKELQRIEYTVMIYLRKVLSIVDSVPVTPGPFSIFRASVFEKIGYFDEKNICEDHEIALRIQSRNFRIESSVTGTVYTEPPDNLADLIKQRVRWQRGGLRNYLNHLSLINPKFGDFGIFFVPFSLLSALAFFAIMLLTIASTIFQPYYIRYLGAESMMLGLSSSALYLIVLLTSLISVYSALSILKEKVKLRYIVAFALFYCYLGIGYNLLLLWKELRREKASW